MIRKFIIAGLVLVCGQMNANAEPLEGDYLYRVSTVRIAPGEFENFLDWISTMKASGYFEEAGERAPFVMRHSQGDQWDLMKITPMESWTEYYKKSAEKRRAAASEKYAPDLSAGYDAVAFMEDCFAYGPHLAEVEASFAANGFFHIEMFEAVAGRSGELLEQRRMENEYLRATGQTPNMIFRRAAGCDTDVFTIGFHKDLEAFAAPSHASDDEREAAAIAAGFKNRADISFYLRTLISGHHDTLAVKVD